MPQQQKPKKKPPKPGVPPEVTAARKAWAEKERARVKGAGGSTATDRAKFATGRGGLAAMGAANKAARAARVKKKYPRTRAAQQAGFKKQLKKISKNLKKY